MDYQDEIPKRRSNKKYKKKPVLVMRKRMCGKGFKDQNNMSVKDVSYWMPLPESSEGDIE